jgi:hypothetical protein
MNFAWESDGCSDILLGPAFKERGCDWIVDFLWGATRTGEKDLHEHRRACVLKEMGKGSERRGMRVAVTSELYCFFLLCDVTPKWGSLILSLPWATLRVRTAWARQARFKYITPPPPTREVFFEEE